MPDHAIIACYASSEIPATSIELNTPPAGDALGLISKMADVAIEVVLVDLGRSNTGYPFRSHLGIPHPLHLLR